MIISKKHETSPGVNLFHYIIKAKQINIRKQEIPPLTASAHSFMKNLESRQTILPDYLNEKKSHFY